MALDLSSTFKDVLPVLNDLLSKYTSVVFIGYDQANENKRYYMSSPITKGFYYKARKTPVTGEVVEKLRIVPENSAIDDIIRWAEMLELRDVGGNFLRFKFKREKEPNPPNYEWVLDITPTREDKSPIT